MTRKTKIIGIAFIITIVFVMGYLAGQRGQKKIVKEPSTLVGGEKPSEEQDYTCGMHPFYVQKGPGNCPICGMKLTPVKPGAQKKKEERKIKYWRAPMDPTYISDKPGKSPMGMDLIPVYEDEGEEEGLVKIDPVTIQNIGVRTETVTKRALHRIVRTVGRITYDEKRIFHVHTKITGWIDKLYVNFTGEAVRRGQPLISLYSPDLVSSQKEYLQALDYRKSIQKSGFESIRESGESLVDATRRRLELWDITPQQIKILEETRNIQKNMTLYSPVRGIVVKMEGAREGMYVQPGMNLYTIADISRVWVEGAIYEYELPWIHLGQKAFMTLAYYPGKEYAGKITFINPFLEEKTRTVKVRLEFDNPDFELKPEMYADVMLSSDITREGIGVPTQAVIFSGKRNLVVIDRGEGRFESREVKVGAEAEGYYQVLEGVKEGEKVVTSAQFLIDSESNLKAAIAMMQEPKKESRMNTDLDMTDFSMKDIEAGDKKNMEGMPMKETSK